MRVLLISGNQEDVDIRVPPLGLAFVAEAAAKSGHEVRLLDFLVEKDPRTAVQSAIRDTRPDVIGVSVRNIDDQRMRDTKFLLNQARDAVAWCRASSEAPIILGGAGFSIMPKQILNYLHADMGIQGEGEMIFPELLRRIQSGKDYGSLPGLIRPGVSTLLQRSFHRNLDALPLPDPALLTRTLSGAKDAPVPIQTRRGCPMSCSYCSTPTIEGKIVRWRSPESIVEWMTRWVEQGFKRFYFVDNTFNLPLFYASQLCQKIISAGIDAQWRCILFPGGITPGLIELLAKAGCTEVSLGFESGSGHVLRRMHKHFETGEVRRASDLLRQHGIRRMGFLLLGGPGETMESAAESLDFAEALELDSLRISVGIRIYPHTDVARIATEEGLISSEEDLLFPRFYVTKDLEEQITAEVARRMGQKANWIF